MRVSGIVLTFILVLAVMVPLTFAQVNINPAQFSQPMDPANALATLIVSPIFNYSSPSEATLRSFYHTWLSTQTQESVTEDQWVTYWIHAKGKVFGATFWTNVLVGGSTWDVYALPTALASDGSQVWKITINVHKRGTDYGFGIPVYSTQESNGWKLLLNNEMLALMTKPVEPAPQPQPAKTGDPYRPAPVPSGQGGNRL